MTLRTARGSVRLTAIPPAADTTPTRAAKAAKATTARDPQGGVLHNAHDVKAVEAEINTLVVALANLGARLNIEAVDLQNLRPRMEAYAACRILVQKGICTEDEIGWEQAMCLRNILAAVLAQVEAQRLQTTAPQPVRGPGLIVPGRH